MNMKRLLSALLVCCGLCVCALAESYQGAEETAGDATLLIPQTWTRLEATEGDEAVARYTDGDRQITLYAFADTTLDGLLQSAMQRTGEIDHVSTLMLGDRMAVQFDWLTEGVSCLAVGDDEKQKQLWLCYSPVTDSELGLLLGEVAKTVSFQ